MNPTGPQNPTQTLLLIVLAIVFVGLMDVTHRYPGLAMPLTVAMTGVGLVIVVLGFDAGRR
ncbi:hypothetical protein [Streptomyces sp. NPDC088258]|uniref:hypothetical protein n=1 Tax=Streptomyces sp. NPDC088258 TaxID=3365849 RepID=UPI0037F8E71E